VVCSAACQTCAIFSILCRSLRQAFHAMRSDCRGAFVDAPAAATESPARRLQDADRPPMSMPGCRHRARIFSSRHSAFEAGFMLGARRQSSRWPLFSRRVFAFFERPQRRRRAMPHARQSLLMLSAFAIFVRRRHGDCLPHHFRPASFRFHYFLHSSIPASICHDAPLSRELLEQISSSPAAETDVDACMPCSFSRGPADAVAAETRPPPALPDFLHFRSPAIDVAAFFRGLSFAENASRAEAVSRARQPRHESFERVSAPILRAADRRALPFRPQASRAICRIFIYYFSSRRATYYAASARLIFRQML